MGKKAREEKKRAKSIADTQRRAAKHQRKHGQGSLAINDKDKSIIERIMARIIPADYFSSETEPEGRLISSAPTAENAFSQHFDKPAKNLPTNLKILEDLSYLGLSYDTVRGIHNVIQHAVINAVKNQNRANVVRTCASSSAGYDLDSEAPYGIVLTTDTVGYSEQLIADLKLTVQTDLQEKYDKWPKEFATNHTWAKVTEHYPQGQTPDKRKPS